MKKTLALAILVSAALLGACGSKNKNKPATPSNTGGTAGSAMTGGQGYGGAGYGGTATPAPSGY